MLRLAAVLVASTALVVALFAWRPQIDLAVSHALYDGGGFVKDVGLTRLARDAFSDLPFVVIALALAAYVARKRGKWRGYAPSGRALIFLVATMAVGPGLVVNLGFKDHSHRPRPNQTQDFGGQAEFRPIYRFDGACYHNCSFISGEASSGFWMVAPASLLPSPGRGPALVAALAFGVGASALRVAVGGHYLSDVLLGGLVSMLVVVLMRIAFWPRGGAK